MNGMKTAHRLAAYTLATALLASCGQEADPAASSAPPSATSATAADAGPSQAYVNVGGYELFIACRGSGSPTVVFEAGLGGDSSAFSSIDDDVAVTTKTCGYDRAGVGMSDHRSSDSPASAGDLADELDQLLTGAGIDGPIVLVGHSLGGAVEQLFADRYPDRVTGLVFVDPVIAGTATAFGRMWEDGTSTLDMRRSKEELEAIGSFGSIPTIVLTQAFKGPDDSVAPPDFRRLWTREHAKLAARSSDAIHLIAFDSGHMIQDDAPDLVLAAIEEVLAAVRDGQPLTPCDDRFADAGGKCDL
jgi:pimeloyl-ACP methyl ester carboxylesterase